MESIKLDCKAENVSGEFVEAITNVLTNVKFIVDKPEKVRVEMSGDGCTYLISLYTDPEDVGQVIGTSGYIINSIRSLISAIGGKHGVQITFSYPTDVNNRKIMTESPGNFRGAKSRFQDSRV
jgi:predicted RNA-binding protein YlqC (UPF0109 family)